jgi:spermidine synthase
MSDTPFEWDTCREFVWQARGDVLIAGLGLGMVLLAVQAKERVTSITVLEKDPDVMALVAPQLPLNSKVRIVQADVFKWQRSRGQKFDTLWFDIWADICGDNARDFPRLRALYKTARRTGAWTGMWSEDLIR